jgi:CheY-like chemotaxis protein
LLYAHRRQKQAQILALAKEEAEEANRAKSEFLSRMSHDIRTPLNGIIGMTYLAKEEPVTPAVANYLDKIDTSSKFLLGLVNDILDMSKAESGKIVLHPEAYPLKDCLAYLEAVIAPLCREKNQQFVKNVASQDEIVPLLDKLRVNQILFNLLLNAVKFTPEGGTITISFDYASINDSKKLNIHFSVQDTGVGMSEKFLKVIYQPFAQEDHADPTMPRQGTGLGLTITKKLVEAMDGTIAVQSEAGKGTRFDVSLPADTITKEEYQAKLDALKSAKEASPDSLRGKRILLCEDNALNQEIAKRLLLDKGMEVTIASDGVRGVELFAQSPEGHFDAILMDIRMPLKNGYEAARDIRALPREDVKSIPIIAMTADAFADDVQKCLEAGMNAHLAKPINPAAMYQKLAQLIAQRYQV